MYTLSGITRMNNAFVRPTTKVEQTRLQSIGFTPTMKREISCVNPVTMEKIICHTTTNLLGMIPA